MTFVVVIEARNRIATVLTTHEIYNVIVIDEVIP